MQYLSSIRTVVLAALPFLLAAPLLSQQGAAPASIHIEPSQVIHPINPRMYAAFVEMMAEDVKRGLTAEMLLDRSFEEPADYLHLPAHWQLEPDERNDNVGAIQFAEAAEDAYPRVDAATRQPNHSLRITVHPGDITDARRGLSQGRLSVAAGKAYQGYFWAKIPATDGYIGRVRIALEEDNTDGAVYAEAALSGLAGDWRQYTFRLTPTKTDRFAKFSVLFDGRGTLLLDQLSLEPAEARGQVRPDSEARIAELRPSFLRWPGGNVAQDYHWQWGVGPRDLRPVWTNRSWSNAPEPDDLGTDEYLALCERLHMEPSITVNVDGAGATVEEAAAWVEYVNGPPTSKYGAMRAANGHPAPYRVRQWELGNEIFGSWVRGHVTAEQYAEAAVRYARAMRAVDPEIRLIAVGEGDAWNSAVLRIAGSEIQYLAVHDYTSAADNAKLPEPRSAMLGRAGEYEANYRHMGDLIQRLAPGRGIKLIVNEWNLFYDAATIQSMEGAVYASRMMNGFERDGDIVEANSISDLLNGWVGGILQVGRDCIYGTPQFYAVQLYSRRLGTELVGMTMTSPKIAGGLQALDAAATRAGSGAEVYLKVSNADTTRSITTAIDVGGQKGLGAVTLDLLTARGGKSRNSFSAPEAVVPTESILQCSDTCRVDLPPNSVAVLTFRLKPGSSQN